MLHVVLYQPEIPPNTGNIIRLCANTGARLHLIEPLGFSLSDARVKRAGLDYHELARVETWPDWPSFLDRHEGRLFAFSSRAGRCYTKVRYRAGDAFLFGPETRGLPGEMLDQLGSRRCLRLPMLHGSRSLNLSNSVAVTVYEAWRQLGFEGASERR